MNLARWQPLRAVVLACIVGWPAAHARVPAAEPPACSRATGPVGLQPAQWAGTDASAPTRAGHGRLAFRGRDGAPLQVYYYRPSGFEPARGPIWFVLPGRGRDASRYARQAAAPADRYNALVLAMEFPLDRYPTTESYTLGVVSRGRPDRAALREGRWRDPSEYLYNELERVFDAVKARIGGRQQGYYLFGHSAGAQFTHRMLTFVPCARVLGAVAANAGWYTLPVHDARHPMPYSLRATPLGEREQRALLAAPLTLLLGTEDIQTAAQDDDVRDTPGARDQGSNRLERGRNYFAAGQRLAQELRAPLAWRLVLAPGAGHSAAQVVASAAWLLFAPPDETACAAGGAPPDPGIVVSRVRTDGAVEIVNKGRAPVCLTGWTVQTQASGQPRVLPIGPALDPGQTMVVPGNGDRTRARAVTLRDPGGKVAGHSP